MSSSPSSSTESAATRVIFDSKRFKLAKTKRGTVDVWGIVRIVINVFPVVSGRKHWRQSHGRFGFVVWFILCTLNEEEAPPELHELRRFVRNTSRQNVIVMMDRSAGTSFKHWGHDGCWWLMPVCRSEAPACVVAQPPRSASHGYDLPACEGSITRGPNPVQRRFSWASHSLRQEQNCVVGCARLALACPAHDQYRPPGGARVTEAARDWRGGRRGGAWPRLMVRATASRFSASRRSSAACWHDVDAGNVLITEAADDSCTRSRRPATPSARWPRRRRGGQRWARRQERPAPGRDLGGGREDRQSSRRGDHAAVDEEVIAQVDVVLVAARDSGRRRRRRESMTWILLPSPSMRVAKQSLPLPKSARGSRGLPGPT